MPEFSINSSVEKPIYHFSSYCWLSSRNSCPVSSQHDQKDFQIYKANNAHKHPIMDINLTMHIVIPGIVKELVSIQINTLLIWFLSDQQLQYKTYYNFSEERKGKEKENQPTKHLVYISSHFAMVCFTSFSPPMLFVPPWPIPHLYHIIFQPNRYTMHESPQLLHLQKMQGWRDDDPG